MISLADIMTPHRTINADVTDCLLSLASQRVTEKAAGTVKQMSRRIPDSASVASAMELLQSLPMQIQRDLCLHPTFSFWLQAVRRISQREGFGDCHKRLFRELASIVAVRALATDAVDCNVLSVPLDAHGGLRCPTLSRYIEFGPAYAHNTVLMRASSGSICVRLEDGLTIYVPLEDVTEPQLLEPPPTIEEHGYTVSIFSRVGEGRIEVYNRDPWLRVKLSGTNQRATGVVFDQEDTENYPESFDAALLDLALGEVKAIWPEQYEDLRKITRVIVPMKNKLRVMAFTVSSRQGAIFVGPAGIYDLIEMLLHENAHIKLRHMQLLDTILKKPQDDSARFAVPWRPDKRPIPGILEGTFVFTHVGEFLLRSLESGRQDGPALQDRAFQIARDVSAAMAIVRSNAELTAFGSVYADAMSDWIADLSIRAEKL